jgi:hypothetical protein
MHSCKYLRFYTVLLLIILQLIIGCTLIPISFQSDICNTRDVGMMLMRICALYERRIGILAFTAVIITCSIAFFAVGLSILFGR